MLCGVLLKGTAVVVEIERLPRLDRLYGMEKQMHSAFVAKSKWLYILQLWPQRPFHAVVYPWKKTRDVPVLLRNNVQAFRRAMAPYQHEYTIVLFVVQSFSGLHDFSDVFGYYRIWLNIISCNEIKAFYSILFNFEGADKPLLRVNFELFVHFLILFVKPEDRVMAISARMVDFQQLIFILVQINLIIDEGKPFSCEGIVKTGLILNDKVPWSDISWHLKSKISMPLLVSIFYAFL